MHPVIGSTASTFAINNGYNVGTKHDAMRPVTIIGAFTASIFAINNGYNFDTKLDALQPVTIIGASTGASIQYTINNGYYKVGTKRDAMRPVTIIGSSTASIQFTVQASRSPDVIQFANNISSNSVYTERKSIIIIGAYTACFQCVF